MRTITKAVSMH